MTTLPYTGKVSCFKCRKVYAVVSDGIPSDKKVVTLIEPFTYAKGSTPMSPLLRCTCGFLTPMERGLFPHPLLVGNEG